MLLNCSVEQQRDLASPSYRKSVLNIHWKDWCWNWNSNTLATWCEELTHFKRPWWWVRLQAGRLGDDRGWDGWMASLTQWRRVWVNSRSWWWTGKPGVLQSMGLQRAGHNWVTELSWTGPLNWDRLGQLELVYDLGLKILERSGKFHFGDMSVCRLSPPQPFPPPLSLAGPQEMPRSKTTRMQRPKVLSTCLGWLQALTRVLRFFCQAEILSGKNDGFMNRRRGLQAQNFCLSRGPFLLVPS